MSTSNASTGRSWRSSRRVAPVVRDLADAGLSGSSMIRRPALQELFRTVRAGDIRMGDGVITESLDRLSRGQADIATIFEILQHARVRLVTVAEGLIDEWKIGMLGAKNAVYLKDLAQKTRRGLHGCAADGRAAGGLSYGYMLDRSQTRWTKRGANEILRGVLKIYAEQAAVVERIHRLYAAGMSPKAIAKLLNSEGIPGPRGRVWRASTIHGNASTGIGILNNELYVGRLVHGRREYRVNPETGRRGKASMNPASSLTITEVPHLRVVDDALWQQVKVRQQATRRAQREGIDRARKPKFLFSKLTKCGVCGGGFTTESRGELRCHNYIAAGPSVCTNSRVIPRNEVEQRVLVALQRRFFTKERLDEFTRLYVAEANRLRAEDRATRAAAPRELDGIKRRAMEILNFMRQGYMNEEWKAELRRLDERRTELEAVIAAAKSEPAQPALHPKMAEVFERQITQLAQALEHDDLEQRTAARETVRGFIDRIVIPPGDELLQVVGNLGEMLTAAGARNGSTAAVGNGGCGGPQQIVPAALLGGSVNVNTLAFLTEVPGARRVSLG
jgi:site-specific DNA recombinase